MSIHACDKERSLGVIEIRGPIENENFEPDYDSRKHALLTTRSLFQHGMSLNGAA
jgi:hypothetical protein